MLKLKYFVTTADGYWGRGDTLKEAAKNANLSCKWTRAYFVAYHPDMVELNPNGIGGYTIKSACELKVQEVEYALFEFNGQMKMLKGEPTFQTIKSGELV